MPLLQRHDLLVLTTEGQERIGQLIRASGGTSGTLMAETFGAMHLPAIVRRRAPCDLAGIGVGISFPLREDDQRLRFATTVTPGEIVGVISPYAIADETLDLTVPPLRALQAIKDLGLTRPGNLGVYGASALQVVTGMNYVDDRSDLDLIIRGETVDSLYRINRELSALAHDMGIAFDVEAVLGSGGAVKLKELCSQQKTVLVKSLLSVEIINKNNALSSLSAA